MSKKNKKKSKQKSTTMVDEPLLVEEKNELVKKSDKIIHSKYEEELISIISSAEQEISNIEAEKNEIINKIEKCNSLKLEVNEYLSSNHGIYEKIRNDSMKMHKEFIDDINEKQEICYSRDYLFFDFENNSFYCGESLQMPNCYLNGYGKEILCSEYGVYANELQYSAAKLFMADKKSVNLKMINSFKYIRDSLINKYNISSNFSLFCMVPEYVDVFNTQIRSCLNASGLKILSIPKSIALSYSLLSKLKIGERYYVIDLDGLHPVITQLKIGRDAKGDKVIQREGFVRNCDIKFDIIKFTEDYIKRIESKYSLSFTKNEKDELIYNKGLYELFSRHCSKRIFREDSIIYIPFDVYIFEECIKKYYQTKIDLFENSNIFVSSVIPNVIQNEKVTEVSFESAFDGLNIIRNILLKDSNAIIWKEMLPKLSLEVINERTGRLEYRDLIDDSDTNGQNINLSVDEEFEIAPAGIITLHKGKKDFYLPLKREIYAEDINSEKEAHFTDKSFPLTEDLKVQLIVKYNYLAESPIRIYARPLQTSKFEGFYELGNSWEDPHIIDNYSGLTYEGRPTILEPLKLSDMFMKTATNMKWFLKGRLDLSSNCFTKTIGHNVHDSLMTPFKAYIFIRNLFDSQNKNAAIFKKLYDLYDMQEFFAVSNNVIDMSYNSYLSICPGISKENFEDYKKEVMNIVSDVLVSSWYIDRDNDDILELYEKMSNTNKIKVLIKLSRCILSKEDDIHNIFEKLSNKLCDFYQSEYDHNRKNLSFDAKEFIRTMSSNCWHNKEWIFMLYYTDKGDQLLRLLVSFIHKYLASGTYAKTKEYRDILEFLVCLIRLNKISDIFNPNYDETKDLLKLIKSSYEEMLHFVEKDKLESRLFNDPNEKISLWGYEYYVYILIITLSGEGQVNLVGYRDE